MGNAPALQYLLVPVLTTHRRLYTTGYTDGYASLTLRVMRDGEPGGFNMNNDGCNPSEAMLRTIHQPSPSEAMLRTIHQPSPIGSNAPYNPSAVIHYLKQTPDNSSNLAVTIRYKTINYA